MIRVRKRHIGLLALMVGLGLGCAGVGKVRLDSAEVVGAGDFKLGYGQRANREAAEYSEQLMFSGRFAAGGALYLRLLITNLAGAAGRAELLAVVTAPDGRRIQSRIRRKFGKWRHGKGEFDVQLGENRIAFEDGEAQITLRLPRIEADWTLTSGQPGFRPQGGSTRFGNNRYYQTTVVFARGQIEGETRVDSGKENELAFDSEGVVYGEHRAGNVAPYVMSRRWIQVRDVGAERTFILSAFQRPKRLGGEVHAWMFVADDDGFLVYEPSIEIALSGFVRDEESGYDVPTHLSFKAGEETIGVVKGDEQVGRKDDLEGLGGLIRHVVSTFMRPFTFRYRTRYLVRRPLEGVESFSGQAAYTYQQLN